MRRLLASVVITTLAAMTVAAQDFPSKWFFGKDFNSQDMIRDWRDSAMVKATYYGDAVLRVLKSDGSIPHNSKVMRSRPVVGPMAPGDMLMMEFPDSDLPAGSYVEFDLTFSAEEGAPSEWIFEYLDGGKWLSGDIYRVYGSPFEKTYQVTSVFETVRLEYAAAGTMKFRMRALESAPVKSATDAAPVIPAGMVLQNYAYMGAYAQDFGTVEPKDTLNVLYIGNSFTYFTSSPSMLKEIAWNEGHYIDMTSSLKGGAFLGDHLKFSITEDAISKGNFDLAILQDHSKGPVSLGLDRRSALNYLNDAVSLADKIREHSPRCRFMVEYRSSATPKNNFYNCGSLETYNAKTLKGTKIMAKAIGHAKISHITEAFMTVRRDRPDIAILAPDGAHPSMLGAYLKSCVNYLTIYGEEFGPGPADCGISPDIASYLRSVAEKVVLKKR